MFLISKHKSCNMCKVCDKPTRNFNDKIFKFFSSSTLNSYFYLVIHNCCISNSTTKCSNSTWSYSTTFFAVRFWAGISSLLNLPKSCQANSPNVVLHIYAQSHCWVECQHSSMHITVHGVNACFPKPNNRLNCKNTCLPTRVTLTLTIY